MKKYTFPCYCGFTPNWNGTDPLEIEVELTDDEEKALLYHVSRGAKDINTFWDTMSIYMKVVDCVNDLVLDNYDKEEINGYMNMYFGTDDIPEYSVAEAKYVLSMISDFDVEIPDELIKKNLRYQDVSDIFEHNFVWYNGYEKYWYQYAWSILEEQNLTCYSDSLEQYKVMLYAFTLIIVNDN